MRPNLAPQRPVVLTRWALVMAVKAPSVHRRRVARIPIDCDTAEWSRTSRLHSTVKE